MLFFSKNNKKFLKRKGSSLLGNSPPHYDDRDNLDLKERAPYAAFRLNGSLTVEASLVLPVFIFAIVALLFFIQAIKINVQIQKAVYNQTMKVAGYSYYLNVADPPAIVENLMEAETVKAMIINELGTDFMNNPYLVNGSNGFTLNFTNIFEEDILDVALQYKLKVPFDIFRIGKVPFVARARCKTWGGEETDKSEIEKEIVYVTTYGVVYHEDRKCTYIESDIMSCSAMEATGRQNASGSRYGPCSLCTEGTKMFFFEVYFTKYGTKFHVDKNCSNLKSSVFSINRDSAEKKYRPCSKCSKGD